MAEFINFLSAPGPSISSYNRTKPHTSQPKSVPPTFLDCMSVREEVFVKEQGVPPSNELDADDPRSYHWVVYASVGNKTPPAQPSTAREPDTIQKEKRNSNASTATRMAVGTVRLVPPPHPPHPTPGSGHAVDNSEDAQRVASATDADNPGPTSTHNPHNEPYVKIGRLAVLAPFRGLGLARLLLNTALDWAAANPRKILPAIGAADREARRLEHGLEEPEMEFKGLVLIHAQVQLERLYRRWGFERDEGMGVWEEEGMEHVGMWKRVGMTGK